MMAYKVPEFNNLYNFLDLLFELILKVLHIMENSLLEQEEKLFLWTQLEIFSHSLILKILHLKNFLFDPGLCGGISQLEDFSHCLIFKTYIESFILRLSDMENFVS